MTAKGSLVPGVEGRLERDVDDSLLTRHVGGRGIFATPAMIGLMELCSHRSVEPLLAEGETTVGFEVCIRHLASSEPGARLAITSRLTRVEGQSSSSTSSAGRGPSSAAAEPTAG